jgi:histidinol phosphatase-like enzyme
MIKVIILKNDELILEHCEHTKVALYEEDTMVVPTVLIDINTKDNTNASTKIVVTTNDGLKDDEFDILDFKAIANKLNLTLK